MMQFLISLGFGILVGVAYGLSAIKSPAPPVVALFGLLGIVIGEQGVTRFRQRNAAAVAAERSAAIRADQAPLATTPESRQTTADAGKAP